MHSLAQAFIYLAAVQLLFSAQRESFLASGIGFLVGVLYRSNFLGIRKFKVRIAPRCALHINPGRERTPKECIPKALLIPQIPRAVSQMVDRTIGRVMMNPAASVVNAANPPTRPEGPAGPSAQAPARAQVRIDIVFFQVAACFCTQSGNVG